MAIAAQLDFAGVTLDQYEQVIKLMGLTPGGPGPAGMLFHWVAVVDDGIRVVDVWETQEAFDTFAKEQIGPRTAEAGMPQPTSVQVLPVHNYFTAG